MVVGKRNGDDRRVCAQRNGILRLIHFFGRELEKIQNGNVSVTGFYKRLFVIGIHL